MSTWWPGSNDWSVTYGGAADDWSSGYDYDDVTNVTFGVQLSAYNDAPFAAKIAYIDTLQIKIYYTDTGTSVNLDVATTCVDRRASG